MVAKDLIDRHRDSLELIANSLLEYETLDGSQVDEIVRTWTFTPPSSTVQAGAGRTVPPPVPAEGAKATPPILEPGLGAPAPAAA